MSWAEEHPFIMATIASVIITLFSAMIHTINNPTPNWWLWLTWLIPLLGLIYSIAAVSYSIEKLKEVETK